ncbi:MAG: hypothetical protein AAF725_12815 [Acidobacteriota bacterium]
MRAGARDRASVLLTGLGLAALFLLASIVATWPLPGRLNSGLALGTETVATVPLLNLWTLAWNVESLGRGSFLTSASYWQAPIFHPAPDTLALSEPQPLSGLLAALLAACGLSILAAYNVILIASLAINGWLACLLSRAVGLGWPAAAAGGGMVLLLPFTHQELGVLQLVPLAGVLLFALAVLRFREAPGVASGCLAGLALAVAYGFGSQVAVFAAMASAPAVLWWWREPLLAGRSGILGAAAAAGLFLVLVSPLLIAQSRATAGQGFERSEETARRQSARLEHYRTSAWAPLAEIPGSRAVGLEVSERPSSRAFWPGTLRVLLACFALFAAWRSTAWRPLAVAGALCLASGFLLSLGGHLAVGPLSLLDLLRPLPGLSQIRSFFRFALFAQLAVVGLAALGLHLLAEAAARRLGGRALLAAQGAVLALAALAVLEIRPAMGPVEELPPLSSDLPWLNWILEESAPEDVLAFVPFPDGRSARAYLGTGQWMYWQMSHWRPMVNGYSGFFPADFRSLKKAMQTFPDRASLEALGQAGVRFCIVHRAYMAQAQAPDPAAPLALVPRFQDEQHALAIFELLPRDSARRPSTRR